MLIVATYLDPVPEPAHTPPSGTPCLGQPLATPHLLLQPLALTQAMLAQVGEMGCMLQMEVACSCVDLS